MRKLEPWEYPFALWFGLSVVAAIISIALCFTPKNNVPSHKIIPRPPILVPTGKGRIIILPQPPLIVPDEEDKP